MNEDEDSSLSSIGIIINEDNQKVDVKMMVSSSISTLKVDSEI